jgi:hypothetical protein
MAVFAAEKVNLSKILSVIVMVSLLIVGVRSFSSSKAYGVELSERSLKISDSSAGTHDVTYDASFTLTTPGAIGSIAIEFCSNSTFVTDPCTAPYGLDALNATIAQQSGATGFQLSPDSTVNELLLTRASVYSPAVPVSYTFQHMVNPTDNGSYYVRVLTYASSDGSGPATDDGGMAFVMQQSISIGVSTEIPPYLTFCVADVIPSFTHDCSGETGDYIDLGNFDTSHTSSGTTQFMTATNAQSGYSVYVQGDTLTSGNNIISPATADSGSQVGTSQFGINLRANTNPVIGANPDGPGSGIATSNYDKTNLYQYNSGDAIASSLNADDFRRYTVSYIVNIAKSQPVGIYASTFTYICLANF